MILACACGGVGEIALLVVLGRVVWAFVRRLFR